MDVRSPDRNLLLLVIGGLNDTLVSEQTNAVSTSNGQPHVNTNDNGHMNIHMNTNIGQQERQRNLPRVCPPQDALRRAHVRHARCARALEPPQPWTRACVQQSHRLQFRKGSSLVNDVGSQTPHTRWWSSWRCGGLCSVALVAAQVAVPRLRSARKLCWTTPADMATEVEPCSSKIF